MPAEKRKLKNHSYDIKDDLNYIDDASDLSSRDSNVSDEESLLQERKRGKFEVNQDDESDIDETGEHKVDKNGRLLGGRDYGVPTFKLPTRGDTLYMFAKDPAAYLGFRDSFVFVKKNPKLVKVQLDTDEKNYLVENNILRSTFRTREISVVTARSVFKLFGHLIVYNGKIKRDDYHYIPPPNAPAEDEALQGVGKNNLAYAQTARIDHGPNWLHNAAVSTRQFNASMFSYRRSNPSRYDMLTHVYQITPSKQTFTDN